MLTLYLHLRVVLADAVAHAAETLDRRPNDRGSVTMEQVLWAVAVIVIVGIVVTAITAYVTGEAAKIK